MKTSDLSEKVKNLRFRKGLSQEQLAETTGLSLRTIQRIESAESEPRGDSLKRLAFALSVSPEEIADWTVTEDHSVIIILQLSQLGFIFFPILGIILPLAIWLLQKDKAKLLNETGKKILNFQISWNLFLIIYLAILAVLSISMIEFRFLTSWIPSSGRRYFEFTFIEFNLLVYGILYVYNIVLIVTNIVRRKKGIELKYRPAFRFIN